MWTLHWRTWPESRSRSLESTHSRIPSVWSCVAVYAKGYTLNKNWSKIRNWRILCCFRLLRPRLGWTTTERAQNLEEFVTEGKVLYNVTKRKGKVQLVTKQWSKRRISSNCEENNRRKIAEFGKEELKIKHRNRNRKSAWLLSLVVFPTTAESCTNRRSVKGKNLESILGPVYFL